MESNCFEFLQMRVNNVMTKFFCGNSFRYYKSMFLFYNFQLC